jgi:hypothetical protein
MSFYYNKGCTIEVASISLNFGKKRMAKSAKLPVNSLKAFFGVQKMTTSAWQPVKILYKNVL